MIYFIAKPDRSEIKIGTTIRLSHRLQQLAYEHGDGLEVLAVVDGSRDAERELHRRFAHLRTVGEWFEPGDDLLGFIVAEASPWDGTDEVPPRIDDSPISIRAQSEWKEWLVRYAESQRQTTPGIIDRALAMQAKRDGFEPPPKRKRP